MVGCVFHGTATPIWLTHTNTHSCHYYKTQLQNIISSVPDRASAKPAIMRIQNPQSGLQNMLNRAALVYIGVFLIHSFAFPLSLHFVFPLLFSQWLLFTFLTFTSCRWSPLLKSKSLMGLTSAHKPCLRIIARPRRVRELRMKGACSQKEQVEKCSGHRQQVDPSSFTLRIFSWKQVCFLLSLQ